jgi:hypothetical protein
MRKLRVAIVSLVIAGFGAAIAVPAGASAPGPGDKQCVPGQNSQPHPAQKGGTCPPKK